MPISKAQADNLTPRDKPFKVFDTRGLFLLVNPNGSRLWRMKFRFEGKERVLSFGPYPEVGIKAARDLRDKAHEQKRAGIMPTFKRQPAPVEPEPEGDSFKGIAKQWLAKGCPRGKKNGTVLKPATLAQHRGRLENHAFPVFGDLPITSIKKAQIRPMIDALEKAGNHELCARVLGLVESVFEYARAILDDFDVNPATSLKGALTVVETKHRSAIVEPEPFGQLLRTIDAYSGQPSTVAALQVMALTALRSSELRFATWSEIDLEAALWSIPGERMKEGKPHLVPLATQAVTILSCLADLTDRGADSLVFPSLRPGRPLSENTLNVALRTAGYDGSQHTSHGFRSSFSTLATSELKADAEVKELCLAHLGMDEVRRVYERTGPDVWLDERRELMQAWADYCDKIKQG